MDYTMSKFLPTGVFEWTDPKDFDNKNATKIVQEVVFLKLILNFQKNYINYIMAILWLQMK